MAKFDISEHVLAPRNGIPIILKWLTDHVGPFYGRGEDPVTHIGAGWEIMTDRDIDWEENYVTSWIVDITDPKLSTLFALTFCGSAI
jgi:hypothetical protein